jgi:hypothetical protein
MDLLERLRDALDPMIDRGSVVNVLPDPEAGFIVYVGDADPKELMPEVNRLVYLAGLRDAAKISVQSGQGPTI